MLDYEDLNDDEKRLIREKLNVSRISRFYFEDNNIIVMKPNDLFEYIYLDEIYKIKDAMELIENMGNKTIKQEDINKTVKQIILEQHDKVTKITDSIYIYKDM